MSPLSATTTIAPATARPAGRFPPPPTRKPRGNPSLRLAPAQPARGRPCPRALVPGVEPRGARPRAGCRCYAPAIRGKLRCRLHGGRSTGPRTPESLPRRGPGLASIRAARTIHGHCGEEARAGNRTRITLLCRTRVTVAAKRYRDFLPAAFLARLQDYAPELTAPRFPNAGITAAQDQMRRRAVAAALAPWRWAIADNRKAARAARKQAAAVRAADPNTRLRPWRPRPRRPTPQGRLTARLSEPLVPERAPAAPDTCLTKPYVPFPPAGSAAPAPMPAPHPHRTAHATPARGAHETAPPAPHVPDRAAAAHDADPPKPYEPSLPVDTAAPATTPAQDPHPVNPEPAAPPVQTPKSAFSRNQPFEPRAGPATRTKPQICISPNQPYEPRAGGAARAELRIRVFPKSTRWTPSRSRRSRKTPKYASSQIGPPTRRSSRTRCVTCATATSGQVRIFTRLPRPQASSCLLRRSIRRTIAQWPMPNPIVPPRWPGSCWA